MHPHAQGSAKSRSGPDTAPDVRAVAAAVATAQTHIPGADATDPHTTPGIARIIGGHIFRQSLVGTQVVHQPVNNVPICP